MRINFDEYYTYNCCKIIVTVVIVVTVVKL